MTKHDNLKHKLFTSFMLILCSLLLHAQGKISVSGLVLDSINNEPLIGVSILEKGTTNGSMTGIHGDFQYLYHPTQH